MNPFFIEYSEYLATIFGRRKVQKISVNTGRSCPNRTGERGLGGCIYCSNASFTPAYCFDVKGVAEQVEAGKRFFARKYPQMRYLAYFQSYTATYGTSIETLERNLREALAVEDVVGIVIGTRPDSLPDATVQMLSALNKEVPVIVEIGVETFCDDTLLAIHRGHTAEEARTAIRRVADAGLHPGVHLIAGLPGEDENRVIANVEELNALGVESLKMHQLQVLKDTPLSHMLERGEIRVPSISLDDYLRLCARIVRTVGNRFAIDRFLASAPPQSVISPKWGLKNFEFTGRLLKYLKQSQSIDQIT